jgi:hypothetical protein
MRVTRTIGAALAAGALALLAPLGFAASASAAEPIIVSITVAMDLPAQTGESGPIVYQVTDVTAGPGPELTYADLVDNPNDWCGTLNVDIDPTTKTILIYSDPDSPVEEPICNFQTVAVTITSAQIGNIVLVEDGLFDIVEGCPAEDDDEEGDVSGELEGEGADTFNGTSVAAVDNGIWTFDYNQVGAEVQLDWATNPEGDGVPSYSTCGSTLLTFTQIAALAATGATVSPLALGVGGAVLVAGAIALVGAAAVRRARA